MQPAALRLLLPQALSRNSPTSPAAACLLGQLAGCVLAQRGVEAAQQLVGFNDGDLCSIAWATESTWETANN